jgi:K+-transporting ATPase ATPase C chain
MFSELRNAFRPAVALLVLFTLLTGLVYPMLVLGIGQAALPWQANGSLIRDGDRIVGSQLIGQNFAGPGYFHGRPSAAGTGYDASASSGSNLGPTSKALADRIGGDVAALREQGLTGPIPADMVTTSASGLDPDVSPATAMAQVARVAAARGLPPADLKALVEKSIDQPLLGFIGMPRVNVLLLNRQLDQMKPNIQP